MVEASSSRHGLGLTPPQAATLADTIRRRSLSVKWMYGEPGLGKCTITKIHCRVLLFILRSHPSDKSIAPCRKQDKQKFNNKFNSMYEHKIQMEIRKKETLYATLIRTNFFKWCGNKKKYRLYVHVYFRLLR